MDPDRSREGQRDLTRRLQGLNTRRTLAGVIRLDGSERPRKWCRKLA